MLEKLDRITGAIDMKMDGSELDVKSSQDGGTVFLFRNGLRNLHCLYY